MTDVKIARESVEAEANSLRTTYGDEEHYTADMLMALLAAVEKHDKDMIELAALQRTLLDTIEQLRAQVAKGILKTDVPYDEDLPTYTAEQIAADPGAVVNTWAKRYDRLFGFGAGVELRMVENRIRELCS